MNIRLIVLGYEILALEIEKPEQTFVFQVDAPEEDEEDEEERRISAICWDAEEFAEYNVYPPGDFGIRTVFTPDS